MDVESTKTQHTFKKFLSGMGLDSLTQLRVEPALIYDAVQFFARTFKQINGIGSSKMRALSCNGSDSWEFGASLTNFMRTVSILDESYKIDRQSIFICRFYMYFVDGNERFNGLDKISR